MSRGAALPHLWVERGLALSWVVIMALILATVAAPDGYRSQLFLHLVRGPIEGWIIAMRERAFPDALFVLVPASMVTFGAAAYHVVRRSRPALVIAMVSWLIAGYLFAVAIWI